MLALRLARGTRPLVLVRRAAVAAAAGGTGFLLLATLGHATAHPTDSGQAAARLLWCLAPLAATAQLAVAVARTDPAARLQRGMAAAGLGPFRLTLLAAVSTGLSGALGVLVALLVFLRLRGGLGAAPRPELATELLGAGHPLPVAGTTLLLALVPLVMAGATALALRPREAAPVPPPAPTEPGDGADGAPRTAPAAPSGLPWGIALTAVGLTVETYAGRGTATGSGLLPLPGRLVGSPPGVLAGWALSAVGLVLAGPGLVHLCGRLLCAGRPGALRLLAGRVLQEEARRIGRPVGVLCAVASGGYAAVKVFRAAPLETFGPLTAVGAAVVLGCVLASALAAGLESRTARADATAALRRLGAPAALLRRAATLRATTLLLVLAPLTWGVAELATLPLVR
ncbi:hypothetical protein ACGH2B_05890 [Streptomyces sp. BBFR2]|uniref:hypothetical protein n=1 Tax=Streptomyces sp. BBFR2 TaxID=3372854 RepID=UPI0037D9B04D